MAAFITKGRTGGLDYKRGRDGFGGLALVLLMAGPGVVLLATLIAFVCTVFGWNIPGM
jgi:hypothetical protein